MKRSPSKGFIPDASESIDFESDDDEYGVFCDGEETELVTKTPEGPEIPMPAAVSVSEGARSIQKKSALKKNSSYGSLEPLGVGIPISDRKRSWKVLPMPSAMKRTDSTASFFHNNSNQRNTNTESLSESSEKLKRNVSFSNIHVRDYNLTIGDNPSTLYGTPIQLDWKFVEQEPVDLDSYEGERPRRRTIRQMHINSFQRAHILRAYQHTNEEIKNAKRDASKARRQRSVTLHTLPLMKLEDIAESIGRKARRLVGKQDAESSFVVRDGKWGSMNDLTTLRSSTSSNI